MYSVDLKNIVPKRGLTCLFAKATSDESKLWHRRLGHLNFKTMNKLVKGNLVRGLPSKLFENDQTCVACQKGKQHKASCKSKIENSISLPLHLLHMDLFGPTFVKSLMKKMYCLVVTDDYSRFTWVFFLATKDETSGILKSFIIGIENLVDHKVMVIRCVNGTEFKNREMNQFYEKKGILRQFSVARTPQQNRVAERRNRTLIKAARTMLADSKTPTLSFMRPFGYPVTILNTIDHLDKFDGKADEGFFIGYSLNSKAFRVFNSRTRIVEENMHIRFSTKESDNADPKSSHDDGSKPSSDVEKKVNEDPRKDSESNDQKKDDNVNNTNNVNAASTNEGTKWVFRNKKDERGTVIRNKERLVAQGYTQEEGIDYDKVFALIARIEAIRLFLAYASFKDFVVYQMDVKSAFLYGKIEEEVYVCQPPGFEDPDFPNRV
ncbi:putative ribonuclease H-like domain-containing protein [Tanacetum coccineum]